MKSSILYTLNILVVNVALIVLSGCSILPHSGPSYSSIKKINESTQQNPIYDKVTIIDLNALPSKIVSQDELKPNKLPVNKLADNPNNKHTLTDTVGKGDVLQITIIETPPAILFVSANSAIDLPKTGIVTLPHVQVDTNGMIYLPFAGRVQANNRTINQIQNTIMYRLAGISNQPQVMVSVVNNVSSNVTVISDGFSGKMPLTANSERLLDAVALLGSSMFDVKDTLVFLTRADHVEEFPLSLVLNNPAYNVVLQKNDIITLINKPNSFISMGAVGATREIPFEAAGINLSQALARIGGLRENLSDARGLFIFRYQEKQTLPVKQDNLTTVQKEMVPVVYQVDLTNPNSLFVMKNFTVQDNDIVYVATAPIVELQKFLYSIFTPSVGLINQATNL